MFIHDFYSFFKSERERKEKLAHLMNFLPGKYALPLKQGDGSGVQLLEILLLSARTRLFQVEVSVIDLRDFGAGAHYKGSKLYMHVVSLYPEIGQLLGESPGFLLTAAPEVNAVYMNDKPYKKVPGPGGYPITEFEFMMA
jgi:hypothetical protein